MAKKRGWDVRKSLRHASRRLTGRPLPPTRKQANRGTAIRLQSPPRTTGKPRDLEKGAAHTTKPVEKRTVDRSMFEADTPVMKSWKQKYWGAQK